MSWKQRQAASSKRRWNLNFEQLESRNLMAGDFQLQILHASDFEAGVPALQDAPRFSSVLNALRDDFANTVVLSSGDNWIPSPFYTAGADPSLTPVLGTVGKGRADMAIINALGVQASVFGNHEFDEGTAQIRSIIAPILASDTWVGANFPYISSNLNFGPNVDLSGVVTADGQEAATITRKIAKSTVITVNGEKIGLVGITTPLLPVISQPGTVVVTPNPVSEPLTPANLQGLANAAQPAIDALTGAGIHKIIVLSHLQNLNNEIALAPYLKDVDLIVGGGSNAILADQNDRLRVGDSAFGTYPLVVDTQHTGGAPMKTFIVNTDGNFQYVGRLVATFDGITNDIVPGSISSAISGAYAADDQGVIDTGNVAVTPRVQQVVDALQAVISVKDGNTFGKTAVYLNGERAFVRTQETNFGNLTADANLATAQAFDPSVVISLKNGGGIRDAIGEIDPATGKKIPPQANAFKDAGEVSQLDIENSLRFNNGLALITVNATQLKALIEHGVAASGQQGRYPQIGGFSFSYDSTLPAGSRVLSLAIKDAAGNTVDTVIKNGVIVGDATRTFRMVTLDFLATGGDQYPFPAGPAVDLVNLIPAGTTKVFDTLGGEQKALADYFVANFATTPYQQADLPQGQDARIQNLAFRSDTVNTPVPTKSIELNKIGSISTGGFAEAAAEISAYEPRTKRLFVVNAQASSVDVIDLSDPTNPQKVRTLDLSALGSPNSVAVSENYVAIAIQASDKVSAGKVAIYQFASLQHIVSVPVGSLPDMLTFTPDGNYLLVANEGEPSSYNDPEGVESVDPDGSVSIIPIGNGVGQVRKLKASDVKTAGFTAWNTAAKRAELLADGVRLFGPNASVSQDLEPEYITISKDSKTAYVTLQENNAYAVIDIQSGKVKEIVPFGYKDHSLPGNELDASDRDGKINIVNRPVFGMFMPDAIASYTVGGVTYLVTANEGDARAYDGFAEEARVRDITLDATAFPNRSTLRTDANIGRLTITKTLGDTDGDGDYDQLFAFGGRSFSIWTTDGTLVYDSGSELERITAESFPAFFNSDHEANAFDNRSDNKGPEAEGVVLGKVGALTYAFVGLERIGGVMVYDVTNPAAPAFVQYINTRDFYSDTDTPAAGDLGPEGLLFVPAADSPNGKPLLIVANEVSGTIAIFEITVPEVEPATPETQTPVANLLRELADYFAETRPRASALLDSIRNNLNGRLWQQSQNTPMSAEVVLRDLINDRGNEFASGDRAYLDQVLADWTMPSDSRLDKLFGLLPAKRRVGK